MKRFDRNSDGALSEAERKAVNTVTVSRKGIASLEGIGFFPNLEYLNCQGNRITSLTLGSNAKLKSAICFDNKLTGLDVSRNGSLTQLQVQGNAIKKIDIGNCPVLVGYVKKTPVVTAAVVAWGKRLKISADTKLTSGQRILYQKGKPKTVTVEPKTLTMNEGESVLLAAVVRPQGVVTKLSWTSSNGKVATVNGRGAVIARSNGTTRITVKTANGKKATCRVTVREKRSVSIDRSNFPDGAFREWVRTHVDGNGDGRLSVAECRRVSTMDVSGLGIGTLKGIEHFSRLKRLECSFKEIPRN